MSDAHPDPLSESFRHVSNHAQVTVTGAARAMEAAASRSERQARRRSPTSDRDRASYHQRRHSPDHRGLGQGALRPPW